MDGPEWGFHADANLNARKRRIPSIFFLPSERDVNVKLSESKWPLPQKHFFHVDSILSVGGYEVMGGKYEDAFIIHRSDLDS